jgi:hypothetical protein
MDKNMAKKYLLYLTNICLLLACAQAQATQVTNCPELTLEQVGRLLSTDGADELVNGIRWSRVGSGVQNLRPLKLVTSRNIKPILDSTHSNERYVCTYDIEFANHTTAELKISPAQAVSLSYSDLPKEIQETVFDGDKMTFKKLLDYSLIDRDHYGVVLRYFKKRFDHLKNAQCPALDAAWINKHIIAQAGELSVDKSSTEGYGLPSFFSPVRATPQQTAGDYHKLPIITINGVRWLALAMANDKLSSYNVISEGSSISPNSAEVHRILSQKKDDKANVGPVLYKECDYHVQVFGIKGFIELRVYDEFLNLPELGLDTIE